MNTEEETFEKHGYFEQLYDQSANRVVGLRNGVALGEREVGFRGRKEIVLEGEVEVTVGHRKKTLRFKVPKTLISTIYPICGRTL